MANILIENLDYTYNGKESTDLFFKPSVMTPDYKSLFRVMDDIQSKKQLNLVGNLRNIVQTAVNCGRPTASSGIDITNRTLEVTELEVFIEQCKDTFEDSIFEIALKNGIDRADIQGTEIETAIRTLVTDALMRDNFDLFSFGDTTLTGTFLEPLDGLWTRLIAGTATYEVERIGGSLDTLAADSALNRLRFMYESSNTTLRSLPINERKFFVTQSIYDNLLTSYESVDSGSDLQIQLLQDGTQSLKFRGIDVIPVIAWDDAIARYSLGSPNRIIYTTPSNHVIGVNRAGDDSVVGAWYERKDKKVYIEALYRMGYNYIHGDLQSIAY